MTPSSYREGLNETLKHIDNSIKSLSTVMDSDKPLMRNLIAYRKDILDNISPWIKTLGQVLSQPNSGLGTWVVSKDNRFYQFVSTASRGGNEGLFVRLIRHTHTGMHLESARDFEINFRLADPLEVDQHEKFLMRKIGCKTLVNPNKPEIPDLTKLIVEPSKNVPTKQAKPSIDPTQCEFYMVTCTGQHGSKVRHTSYDLAEKEAMRIANIQKHPAWIVGVVAKIEPEVKTTFNVKKSW